MRRQYLGRYQVCIKEPQVRIRFGCARALPFACASLYYAECDLHVAVTNGDRQVGTLFTYDSAFFRMNASTQRTGRLHRLRLEMCIEISPPCRSSARGGVPGMIIRRQEALMFPRPGRRQLRPVCSMKLICDLDPVLIGRYLQSARSIVADHIYRTLSSYVGRRSFDLYQPCPHGFGIPRDDVPPRRYRRRRRAKSCAL